MGRGIFIAVLVASAALTATGCGGSTSSDEANPPDTAPASTEAETTTTTAPTTTTTPRPDPGQVYLTLVSESNCAADRAQKALVAATGGDDFIDDAEWPAVQTTVQPLYREFAESMIRFYEGLVANEWPPDVQADIDALVTQLTTESAHVMMMSNAPTVADLSELSYSYPEMPNNAGSIRAKLGLPSNVTDEQDYCGAPT